MSAQKEHRLVLNQRNELLVFGVEELVRFDDQGVELTTAQGVLSVSGEEISVSGLDLEEGTVSIGGRIDSLEYLPEKDSSKGKFFSKFFPG